jgi:phosphatidate cytidylyltransferase
VISGVVMVVIALAVAYQGGWSFALFWLLAGIAVIVEWTDMVRVEPRLPVRILCVAGLVLLALIYLTGIGFGIGVLAAGVVALLTVTIPRSNRDRLWALGGYCYAAVIVLVPTIMRDRADFGLVGLVWMFAVVWATDIAAYFTGRSLGGPKLWPRVSPKKTWSGFCGGAVAATLAGVAVAAVADRAGWIAPANLGIAALVSCIASVASQMGDLAESALKRRFDVKDSSRLIPGHGGVMDRLDGFWAVALLVGIVLLAERL